MGMNVLSLFDGMSCGQIALDRLGIKVDKYFASEIEDKAIKVTKANFPNTQHIGDIREVQGERLGKIDLLIGGSSCQDFSVAGKRKGMSSEKGNITSLEQYLRYKAEGTKFTGQSYLFWEYVRILKDCNPRYFLLENVRMSQDNQDVISKALGVEPININSKLVSGQLRNRFYWTNIPGVTQPDDEGITLQSILDSGYTHRKKSTCLLESGARPGSTPVKLFHRAYSSGFITVVNKSEDHYVTCKDHYVANFKGTPAKGIHYSGGIYDGVRIFSQTEMEKLQTVPVGYTACLTRNEAASVLGNGWTVDVIKHIFSFMRLDKEWMK